MVDKKKGMGVGSGKKASDKKVSDKKDSDKKDSDKKDSHNKKLIKKKFVQSADKKEALPELALGVQDKNTSPKAEKFEEGDVSEYDVIDTTAVKPKPKNNTLRLLLIILLVVIIAVAATITFYYSNKILVYREVNMRVLITPDGNSFDTDTDMLDFAKNHPGGKSTKMITLSTKKDAMVHLESAGNISSFISYSENDFLLPKDTSREIKIILEVPNTTALGYYEGQLKIYFYRQ